VILRCTHVLAPSAPLVERLRGSTPVPGTGAQRVAPVHVADVARVIAAADDRATVTGTWGLAGPEAMRFDALVELVRAGPAATRPAPGAPFTPTQLDYLARDSVLDPTGWRQFEVTPTPVGPDLRDRTAG
jgi:uncharacterized protein YbjT (DUF2867 family)